jgi:hypothetical protein
MRKSVLLIAALLLPALALGQDWRGPAALEVRVEDAKGRNLAGAEVLLVYLSPDGGGQLPSVLTDANGHADIGGLAAGRWSVEVRHAGQMSYRAEIALPADGKPVVQSASHVMAPGATTTMKVKFSRGRGGVSVASPPRAAAPVSPLPPVLPAEPAPAAAPAPAKAPVKELPPGPMPAPLPAPVAAPAPEKAPVKELPPVPTPAPARAPVKEVPPAPVPAVAPTAPPGVAQAPAKAPVKEVPAVAVVPPTAAPSPVVQPPVMPAQPTPPPVAPLPAKTPQAATPAAAVPPAPPVPSSPTAVPPPVAPQAAAAPVAAAPAAQRARLCVECPPGESASWGEAEIPGGAASGCPADLAARLKSVDLSAIPALSGDLGAGCRVLAVELPAGARFTGFRYEAQSAGLAADCLPGRGCPSGGCRFPNEPVLRQDGKRTVLLVAFESTAADLRRAVVAGYSTYSKR